MIGRIVQAADFERVLGSPPRARSAHFSLHYLASNPGRFRSKRSQAPKLSTAQALERGMAVDDCAAKACWLGAVVPKRHARRAVTRALIKRQIRHMAAAQNSLPHGLWVVRLRSPFDAGTFPSAASNALRQRAGVELSQLFAEAVRAVSV